jgi:hypothetical protein
VNVRPWSGLRQGCCPQAHRGLVHNLLPMVDDTRHGVQGACGGGFHLIEKNPSDLGLCSSTDVHFRSPSKFLVHHLATWTPPRNCRYDYKQRELLTGHDQRTRVKHGSARGALRGPGTARLLGGERPGPPGPGLPPQSSTRDVLDRQGPNYSVQKPICRKRNRLRPCRQAKRQDWPALSLALTFDSARVSWPVPIRCPKSRRPPLRVRRGGR